MGKGIVMRHLAKLVPAPDRPAQPKLKGRTIRQLKLPREQIRDRELAARLIAAAETADKGLEGENVTDMSSEDFIALLRR